MIPEDLLYYLSILKNYLWLLYLITLKNHLKLIMRITNLKKKPYRKIHLLFKSSKRFKNTSMAPKARWKSWNVFIMFTKLLMTLLYLRNFFVVKDVKNSLFLNIFFSTIENFNKAYSLFQNLSRNLSRLIYFKQCFNTCESPTLSSEIPLTK